jgi:hypothetical protein
MSLLDMINFGLRDVFDILLLVRQHLDHALVKISQGEGTKPIEVDYKLLMRGNLNHVHKKCAEFLLQSAEDRLLIIWNDYHGHNYTYGDLAIGLKPLLEQMEADLRREYFYHYPRHKALALLRVSGEWAQTLGAFPSVEGEVSEGIDCYALEHNTACVFHMMRVAEIGMRALARERRVSFPKHPLEWADWQNILDEMEKKARAATIGMPRGPKKDAMQAFYNGAIGQLHGFKDTYRNVVMHVRRSYDELDAQRAINQVRDFMNGLSAKIGEKTRRSIPLSRWP